MEYCDENLEDFVASYHKKPYYKEIGVATLFLHICLGLQFIHDRMLTHKDLKIPNILIKYNGRQVNCKIADLGTARQVDADNVFHRSKADPKEMVTPTTTAPEIDDGASPSGSQTFTFAADIFSLGLCLY